MLDLIESMDSRGCMECRKGSDSCDSIAKIVNGMDSFLVRNRLHGMNGTTSS